MESLQWKRREPTTVTRVGGYRTLVEKTFQMPDGTIKSFVTKDAEDAAAVCVIPLTKRNTVLTVAIFRPGPEEIMHELPGGGVDPEEELEAAARRELQEETGYAPGTIAYLGFCRYDAYTNGKRHYFLALDCEPTSEGQKLDAEEHLQVEEITISALMQNAREGLLTDPGAVLLAYDTLKEIAEV